MVQRAWIGALANWEFYTFGEIRKFDIEGGQFIPDNLSELGNYWSGGPGLNCPSGPAYIIDRELGRVFCPLEKSRGHKIPGAKPMP